MKWGLILAVLALAACKTTEQKIAEDDQKCRSYGVLPGSQAYMDCRMKLDQGRSDRAAAANFAQGGGLIGAIQRAND